MVLGLKPLGKPTTYTKYKFWTEPRPCMVLRPKPLGKPTTYKEEYKFWTEPRPCMVLRPKPLGKPTTYKQKYKFWTEPRPCMVLGLKPLEKPNTYRKNTSFGQNQGLAWSSDPSLWGNQLLREKYKFWTEPRPCMVLGLKPLGKPNT